MEDKLLICFTASFPFGKKETYFENELEYLYKSFDMIYIIPIYNPTGSDVKRVVPNNVKVFQPILKQGNARFIEGVKSLRYNHFFAKEFFSKKVFLSLFKLKKWLNSFFLYNAGIKSIENIELSQNTYLYSYWAEIPFFISTKLTKYKKIVRMHGGDFYLERNNGYLPLRKEIYHAADLLLPISKDIQKILITNYKISADKIYMNYLGVSNSATSCSLNCNNEILRFVSCSNVYGLKRVHLILDILSAINSGVAIEWHHFGDGLAMNSLKDYINKNDKPNISITLHGHLTQKQMMEVYQNNYYDWFINVSEYEGLPVSIMEGFSYGIPAIATNVGGTSEIVNKKNGVLIQKNFNIEDLVSTIQSITKKEYFLKRSNAYETWSNSFKAETNYGKLINQIIKNDKSS